MREQPLRQRPHNNHPRQLPVGWTSSSPQVGLHHNRVEDLIDAATPLQQGREKPAGPQLKKLRIQVPRVVVNVPAREPFRCTARSPVRWSGAAPMNAVACASMSCWYSISGAAQIRSDRGGADPIRDVGEFQGDASRHCGALPEAIH